MEQIVYQDCNCQAFLLDLLSEFDTFWIDAQLKIRI
jgi:hypothetical protein